MMKLLEVDWSTIPAPVDDGGASHLQGCRVPSVLLAATSGDQVDLSAQQGRCIVYAYPKTGRPDMPPPDGWDMLPGARGCTPQSCSFRDHVGKIKDLGVDLIYGLSTQDTAYQREAAERLHLPFSILSDEDLDLTNALRLPTFEVDGVLLLKRLTMIILEGTIEHVFYPVFPPDRNAADVIDWLKENRSDMDTPPQN